MNKFIFNLLKNVHHKSNINFEFLSKTRFRNISQSIIKRKINNL